MCAVYGVVVGKKSLRKLQMLCLPLFFGTYYKTYYGHTVWVPSPVFTHCTRV